MAADGVGGPGRPRRRPGDRRLALCPRPIRHARACTRTSAPWSCPQGLGAFDIADRLEEAGVIDDPVLFVAGLWLEDNQHSLKAGEYVFEALVTPRGVMEKLVARATPSRTGSP